MQKLVFLILFICCLSRTSAQILKVDKGNIDADSSKYYLGSIAIDFNINNRSTVGNEQAIFRGLTGNADVAYVADQHAYILITNLNYFKSTGGPLISTGFAHFRINFLRKKKLSYENFTQIQYDDGRNMPLRWLLGGGLRINLKKKDKLAVHLGIGGMFEREEWKSITENDIILRELWKSTNYLSANFIFNELADLKIIGYYQGGYDPISEVFRNRVSCDLVMSIKITKKLAFTTNFSTQYENRPIIPINNFVYSLTNGLKFDF